MKTAPIIKELMRLYLVLFVVDTLNISSSVSTRSNLFLPGMEIDLYLFRFPFQVFLKKLPGSSIRAMFNNDIKLTNKTD